MMIVLNDASGTLEVNCGSEKVERTINVAMGKKLEVNVFSKDLLSEVSDTVYVGENSELSYVCDLESDKKKIRINLRLIHEKPNSKSSARIKCVSSNNIEVITSSELLSGSDGSESRIDVLGFVFWGGKMSAVPRLLVSNPLSKGFHSFKKIVFSRDQMFYLHSRGLDDETIKTLCKGSSGEEKNECAE
jgi:Fe-S cluster assembly scaffold protein SufB